MQKQFAIIGMITGSIIGGYAPMLFGVSAFSYTSVFAGGIGALIGTYIGYKIGQNY